jgi:gamma-glutamyltranspeptidase/glutathione hydrolase
MKFRATISLFFVIVVTWGTLCSQENKVASGRTIMVAAHPLAAQAGVDIYKKGGNVVDAAVATAYVLGVVEPHGSGIGGEGMMLIYDAKTGRSTVIDFKAIAPAAATYQNLDFTKTSSFARTIRGASVPGAVAGLELAREKYGKLDRATVLQPAVEYALKGFEVDSALASNLEYYKNTLQKDPHAKATYYPGSQVPIPGSRLSNPDYGRTLQEIQRSGPSAFYTGRIADLMVADAKANGGIFAKEDLAAYKAIEREPLRGMYRGWEVVTTPPPCGGMHMLEVFNMLRFFDLREARAQNGYDAHLLAETFRLMFKDEITHNGDPEFSKIPAGTIASKNYGFDRFRSINLAKTGDASATVAGQPVGQSTTQLCVMDGEGNSVALTITLSSLFGTAHTVEGAGFLLNNEMQNYNSDPKHPNALAPHKRVVTSLVPTVLLKDGKPVMAVGTPGGDLIISTVSQVIINMIDHGMSVRDAVFAPRLFATFYQQQVEIEPGFSPATYDQLRSLGHTLEISPRQRAYFGAVQAIWRDPATGLLTGVSDPRRSGEPKGE